MKRIVPIVAVLVALVGSQAIVGTTDPVINRSPIVEQIIAMEHGKAPPQLPNGRFIPLPSGGMMQTVREALGLGGVAAAAAGVQVVPTNPSINTLGCSNVFRAPGRPRNVRANVDCGFRFQSEEWVAVNPTDSRNVVVSQNDSKTQGNRTGVEASLDGGRHFGDSVLGNGRTAIEEAPGGEWSFDAFTDPAHAFDSQGNLYYSAIGFDVFQDFFAGLFVWKSNSCLKGTVMHTPGEGSCDPFSPPQTVGAIPVRTNFDNDFLSDDKNLMTADYFPDSPFRDNVYITWTIFDFACPPDQGGFYCESPIFVSRSTDGGVTWSDALEISGSSPDCVGGDLFNGLAEDADSCNFSQGSHPIVGPDGTVYVAFNNCNTPEGAPLGGVGICQQMVVQSDDGGLTWSDPVVAADDIGLQPFSLPGNEIPDCPLFRQCLPPNGFRMGDLPSIGIDEESGKLAVFWADFRNGGPCATDPTFGLPVLPCDNINNDAFAAVSDDGGLTWGEPKLVTGDGGLTAQWQPWGDVGNDGKLYVAYYDRKNGDCEASGCNDITLSVSGNEGDTWSHRPITTDSMPNLTCADNPTQCGFLGDYMSIQWWDGEVHLAWGDTRGRGLGFPEEDIYYARVRAKDDDD